MFLAILCPRTSP